MKKLFILFFTVLLISPKLFANPSKEDLEKIRIELANQQSVKDEMKKKADKVKEEIMNYRKKMISTAKTIQEYEEKVSTYEIELEELHKKYMRLEKNLNNHNEQMINIMSAMQNLSLRPIDTMILMPLSPTDILRSGILLRETVPLVKNSADKVTVDLKDLDELKEIIKKQYREIKKSSKNLNKESNYMSSLLKHKRELQKKFEDESMSAQKKADELAKKANDIKELLAKLNDEKEKRKKEKKSQKQLVKNEDNQLFSNSKFANALGQLPYPIRGNIIKRYGETNESGMQNKGVTIKGRKGAQVIAPYDGTVLFSGPFRGYGKLLIIDHSENYMTLLAGMDRIDSHVGQSLLAGEPVGIMADTADPTLYMEIRRDGHPVNPLPWLISDNKVN